MGSAIKNFAVIKAFLSRIKFICRVVFMLAIQPAFNCGP